MSNYRLIHGDCISKLRELPDNSIDLIVTDPPYGIDYSTYRTHSRKLMNDNSVDWFDEVAKEFARILKLGSHIYCFTDVEMSPDFIFKLRENGFKIRNLLAIPRAVKGNGGNRIFQQQFEYCIFATLGKANQGRNFEETQILKPSESYLKDKRYKAKEWLYRLPDYWYWTKASVHNAKNKLHPTQKNVSCLKDMISLSSKKDEVVLDSFMGSGSTGIAALELNRDFIGIEIDEEYFNIAKNRIEETTTTKVVAK